MANSVETIRVSDSVLEAVGLRGETIRQIGETEKRFSLWFLNGNSLEIFNGPDSAGQICIDVINSGGEPSGETLTLNSHFIMMQALSSILNSEVIDRLMSSLLSGQRVILTRSPQ